MGGISRWRVAVNTSQQLIDPRRFFSSSKGLNFHSLRDNCRSCERKRTMEMKEMSLIENEINGVAGLVPQHNQHNSKTQNGNKI